PFCTPPDLLALHPPPEFLQPLHAIVGLVASDQAGIDGADRGADDPIRLDPRFMESLIDAYLVSAERAAPLKDEHDLPLLLRPLRLGLHPAVLDRLRARDIQHVFLPGCTGSAARASARSNHHRPARPRR